MSVDQPVPTQGVGNMMRVVVDKARSQGTQHVGKDQTKGGMCTYPALGHLPQLQDSVRCDYNNDPPPNMCEPRIFVQNQHLRTQANNLSYECTPLVATLGKCGTSP